MNIAFFGHADFIENAAIKKAAYVLIEGITEGNDALFLLGEHGGFDRFARSICTLYQKNHPTARLACVIPYPWYGERILEKSAFDQIIYPPIEHVPLRFAISHRNRWMIESADAVVGYVICRFGGAYQALMLAKRRKKPLYNLGEIEI